MTFASTFWWVAAISAVAVVPTAVLALVERRTRLSGAPRAISVEAEF
jgi:hypothetical protein